MSDEFRQPEEKGRTFSRIRFNTDISAVLLDNRFADAQAKAGSTNLLAVR